MTTEQPHHHGHVHLDEADWEDLAADTEREGELFLAFVTDTMGWVTRLRGGDAPPVRRVLDIGSGPGVGTVELARAFPDAHVVAVDSSPAMLDRARQRATQAGLDDRISVRLAELPGGVDGLEPAEVIWASMSLHHVGDEVAALRVLHDLLAPTGLIAIAELAEPMRVLPDELDIGRPGLDDRLESAMGDWFASMREGLEGTAPSADLETMLTAAGLESVGSRFIRERLDAPLSPEARRVALGHVRRTRHQLDDRLDDDDLASLDVLSDVDDPRGVMHRPDAIMVSSRQIHIARRRPPR
ncbi:MAG: class I SAM-dependent methyltransferase [Acidimicrobiia bacterium]|jgi:SAM-dependent methyltransferase|nr:class I SAM-dependent methyltransferase [Acidimicrobiia bacterium]